MTFQYRDADGSESFRYGWSTRARMAAFLGVEMLELKKPVSHSIKRGGRDLAAGLPPQ
jgi:hypothetical protein